MSRPAEIYACIYVRELPAQAMLRLRPELRTRPCVVLEGEPPLQVVCSSNAQARALGIVHGMTRVEIDTFPSVAVLLRSCIEEEAAKAALFECAGRFSPRVEDRSKDGVLVCVIDIAGTEKLFGPAASLAKSLLDLVQVIGLTASLAVCGNVHAAVCLARGGRRFVLDAGTGTGMDASSDAERAALASLPLTVLDLSQEHAETFSRWGIHTLGMLAALPEKALIARMGQEGKRLRQLARGEQPHLLLAVEPAFALVERMELDTPVEALDSLLFAIGVLLEQLIVRATTRVMALASVTITLSLEGGASHARTVRPALPSNERRLWIKLLHLDLEAHPPAAAILSLTLAAEPGSTSKVQLGLFSPQLPEAARLDVTLARIRAIVGDDCVGRPVLKDTHRMDGFRMEPFTVPARVGAKPSTKRDQEPENTQGTAMRRLRPAESVTVSLHESRPVHFFARGLRYTVEHAYGPWVTNGDWWNPELWNHEQWDVMARSPEGESLCCCLLHEPAQGCWQMVGLYD